MEALVGLMSGMLGAAVGAVVAWCFATRADRRRLRRDTLIRAAEALQDYRVAYAQWYVEYLLPDAEGLRSWARPPTGRPDPTYLTLMSEVDKGKGRLRVLCAMLYAHFPHGQIRPIFVNIQKILALSGPAHTDPREIDALAEATCDLIPDLVKRYS